LGAAARPSPQPGPAFAHQVLGVDPVELLLGEHHVQVDR
jgi:hypothetical protein